MGADDIAQVRRGQMRAARHSKSNFIMWVQVFYVLGLVWVGVGFAGVEGGRLAAGELQHLFFSEDKLFYLSQSGSIFGFLSRRTGEVMTQYQLDEDQAIVSIDKEQNKVVLRHGRQLAYVLKMQSLHVHEIHVQISFRHQCIRDVLERGEEIYLLTEKDVRLYHRDEPNKAEAAKNILSSGRKGEVFKKIFLASDQPKEHLVLLLTKGDQVCVRTFRNSKRGEDNCLFRTTYEIRRIEKVGENILIETELVNYVIPPDLASVSSFKGAIFQVDRSAGLLSSEFKTYDFQQQIFLPGLQVAGSLEGQQFFVKEGGITCNGQLVVKLERKEKPIRAWSHSEREGVHDIVLEYPSHILEMYEIELGQSLSGTVKGRLVWQTGQMNKPDNPISDQL